MRSMLSTGWLPEPEAGAQQTDFCLPSGWIDIVYPFNQHISVAVGNCPPDGQFVYFRRRSDTRRMHIVDTYVTNSQQQTANSQRRLLAIILCKVFSIQQKLTFNTENMNLLLPHISRGLLNKIN